MGWQILSRLLALASIGTLGLGNYLYLRDRWRQYRRRARLQRHLKRLRQLTGKLLNALSQLLQGDTPQETILYQWFSAHGGEYDETVRDEVLEALRHSQQAMNAAFDLRHKLDDPDVQQYFSLERQVEDWEMLYATLVGRSARIRNLTDDELRLLLDPMHTSRRQTVSTRLARQLEDILRQFAETPRRIRWQVISPQRIATEEVLNYVEKVKAHIARLPDRHRHEAPRLLEKLMQALDLAAELPPVAQTSSTNQLARQLQDQLSQAERARAAAGGLEDRDLVEGLQHSYHSYPLIRFPILEDRDLVEGLQHAVAAYEETAQLAEWTSAQVAVDRQEYDTYLDQALSTLAEAHDVIQWAEWAVKGADADDARRHALRRARLTLSRQESADDATKQALSRLRERAEETIRHARLAGDQKEAITMSSLRRLRWTLGAMLLLTVVVTACVTLPDATPQAEPQGDATGSPSTTVTASQPSADAATGAAAHCPSLPDPTGPTVTVSTEADLRSQAYSAAAGTTILVSPGTYNLSDVVQVVNDGITIRSSTGNRNDVILDGGGMLTTGRYHVILIEADDVTVADLTIRNGDEHGVSVNGSDRPTLYNLHIVDTGYQLVKVNPVGDGSEEGLLACSRLEYTTTSPEDYTNGISAHDAHRWTVRDNEWYRIRTPNNIPAPTILFWSGSSDTIVERNLLVDCYQGIAFGNASHGAGDHTGGIVRNNMIYASMLHDSVVEMVHATGWVVAHNTALLLNPDGLTWGMEARFSDTSGTFAYNLTNMDVINRDGAAATLTGNLITAQSTWFADAPAADLHLVASATAAIDHAATISQVSDDFDGDARPIGPLPDVGADEYGVVTALTLRSPVGGEGWPISSTRQILWDTSGTIEQVSLSYSTDGFASSDAIAPTVANTGVYTWTTPLTPTYSARVRVASAASPVVSDTSGAFTLYDPATLTNTVYTPVVINGYDSPVTDHRIYSTNLVYKGAFAYPAGDDWAYSGHALAYYPDGDPGGSTDGYPGSLYATAHVTDDLVGEMSIPAPVVSSNFGDLPQASVLQPRADITGGWMDNCTYDPKCMYREVDGLAYLPNVDKIAWNLRDWYNVTAYDQDSLGWSDLDMTGAQGVWHIGDRPSVDDLFHNAKACDYLFKAPESFADANLDGKWLIAGNHREGGALGGSQGPTLYALAPWEDGDPPTSTQNLDALALLYYPEIYDCVWTDPAVCHYPGYRAADDWGGGAWVQSATRGAILIFGRKGLGDGCYGEASECGNDPCVTSRGYHAYPYEPQILFYDPEEIKKVLAGTIEPWQVLPFEIHSPTDELIGGECATLGAAAYDQERGLLYVAEQEAGPWGETVVHVWQVD